MMTPLGNDCYQPQTFAMSWQMDNTTGGMMMSSMGRRNSMQHVPFMDFSFFPVREDAPGGTTATAGATDMAKQIPSGMVVATTPPAPQQAPHQIMDSSSSNNTGVTTMRPSPSVNSFVGHFHHQQVPQAAPTTPFHQPTIFHPVTPPSVTSPIDPPIDPPVSGLFQRATSDDISEGSDPVSEPSLAVVSMDSSEHSSADMSASASSAAAEDNSQRFKPFHEEKWSLRYKELLEFHKANGHAGVPHTYPKNPQLARWVKRQRRQFKLRKEGRPSTMTVERLELLDSVGFIWDSHDLNWREKLHALTAFKKVMGHCNVPSNFRDKKLATWVKCQRRQYKLYWDGKPSAMSLNRISALEKVGFEWEIRTTAKNNNSNGNSSPTSTPKKSVRLEPEAAEPLPVHVPSTIGTGEQLFLAKAIASL